MNYRWTGPIGTLLLSVLLLACGLSSVPDVGDGGLPADGAEIDVTADVGSDTATDVGIEAAKEAGTEAGRDAASDALEEPAPVTCTPPEMECAGHCVDLTNDSNNCGLCGHVCPPLANAFVDCSNGVCGIGACNPGFADCNTFVGDGCEANLGTNPSNCGSCGHTCASGATCSGGACSSTSGCTTGTLCGTQCVNTNTDSSNCGSCGHVCAYSQTCVAGTCTCSSYYPDRVMARAPTRRRITPTAGRAVTHARLISCAPTARAAATADTRCATGRASTRTATRTTVGPADMPARPGRAAAWERARVPARLRRCATARARIRRTIRTTAAGAGIRAAARPRRARPARAGYRR